MIKTTYQTPELRNANDEVVQEGAFGKNTALSNSTNDAWIDFVMNNLEALHDTIGDSAPTLDGNGHVVEPANLAIGDEDGVRLKTGYLKTSGGTVSGTLNVAQNLKMQDNQENVFGGFYVPASSATSQYLQIYGGETPSSNGGNLQLPSDGSWTLQAKNGTTAYNLVGGTDGTLKWRGNNVAVTASPAFTGTPTAPTPSNGDNTTKIATTAFVRNNYLPLSGGTLNSTLTVLRGSGGAFFRSMLHGYSRGTAPSSTLYQSALLMTDQNGKRTGIIENTLGSGGDSYLCFRIYNNIGDTDSSAALIIGQRSDGSFYSTAPEPSATSNSNAIATTSWVNTKTSNLMPLSGGVSTGRVEDTDEVKYNYPGGGTTPIKIVYRATLTGDSVHFMDVYMGRNGKPDVACKVEIKTFNRTISAASVRSFGDVLNALSDTIFVHVENYILTVYYKSYNYDKSYFKTIRIGGATINRDVVGTTVDAIPDGAFVPTRAEA